MEFSSKLLENAVYEMSQLPGIGKRTALRLVLHLLNQHKDQTNRLSFALQQMRSELKYCKSCHNISGVDLCDVERCFSHKSKDLVRSCLNNLVS